MQESTPISNMDCEVEDKEVNLTEPGENGEVLTSVENLENIEPVNTMENSKSAHPIESEENTQNPEAVEGIDKSEAMEVEPPPQPPEASESLQQAETTTNTTPEEPPHNPPLEETVSESASTSPSLSLIDLTRLVHQKDYENQILVTELERVRQLYSTVMHHRMNSSQSRQQGSRLDELTSSFQSLKELSQFVEERSQQFETIVGVELG